MYKVDTQTALNDIRTLQTALQRVDDRRYTLVKATAQYGVNLVRERVQLEGRDADGNPLISKSPKRLDRYSEAWGTERQKEGLRTDIVNLTFSGELLNSESWTMVDEGDAVGAGFREDRMSDRAGLLEDQFEAPIFQLSPGEEEQTIAYFDNALTDLVNGNWSPSI